MYQVTATDLIKRSFDNALIPPDPANSDYAAYLTWLAEGNTPEPYVAPAPPSITAVTALQGLLAIDQAGLSLAYTLWADSPLRSFAQKAFINKAQTWKRDDPTLVAAATELGLSEGQLDSLFLLASNL